MGGQPKPLPIASCRPRRAARWVEGATRTGMLGGWAAPCPTWRESTRPQVGRSTSEGLCAASGALLNPGSGGPAVCPRQRSLDFLSFNLGPALLSPAEEDRQPVHPLDLAAVVNYDATLRLAARAKEGPCELPHTPLLACTHAMRGCAMLDCVHGRRRLCTPLAAPAPLIHWHFSHQMRLPATRRPPACPQPLPTSGSATGCSCCATCRRRR